jgi:hypothetical protein
MKIPKSLQDFLQHPHTARISVIDGRGYPHTVPIWYAMDGDELIFFSSRDAKKIGYIAANSKGAVSIGGDPYGEPGYLLKGEFVLEEDRDNHWMSIITHRYETKEIADKYVEDWGKGDLVLMRFKPIKVSKIT